jgi:serine protease Do
MRKTGAFVWLEALVVGLVLVVGLAAAPGARAADPEQSAPWLGVYMQALTPDLREGMDIQGTGGVLVSGVVPDGPAARAGVQKGDVILRVNSRLVGSPNQLQEVIQSARVGQTVALRVYRDGNQRSLSATLRERPSNMEEMQAPEGTEEEETPETPAPGEQREIRQFTLPDMSMFQGLVSRGRLGVRIQSLSPDLGDYFGLRDGHGALVLEVEDNTPAQRAGVKAGDVITRVDDRAVNDASDLIDALRGKEGTVNLRVVRHGTPRTIQARLESAGATGRRGSMRIVAPSPGVRELRIETRDQLQREIDQLKRQVDELQRRLDQKGSGGGD